MQQLYVALQVQDFLLQVVGIGIKLLSAGHRHGILQLGTSHLYAIGKLIALIAQGTNQAGKCSHQTLVHTYQRQTDSGRIHIVGTLSAVTVVVRIAVLVVTLLVAHNLKGTVGNHLVGIHVYRCTCTTLHHIDGEVLVPLTINQLATCLRDGTSNLVVNHAQGVVGLNSCQLYVSDSNDKVGIPRHFFARDMIVVNTTLCLYAVKCIGWYFELAQKV